MSKEFKIGHYVGTVKKDCSKDTKAFAELELLVMQIGRASCRERV